MNQKYTKQEHLKKDNQIKYLFENGIWNNKFPIKIISCQISDVETTSKIGVSVSKRFFKRAVDRNYLKRLLRECYRLHKEEFNAVFNRPHFVMIIYGAPQILSFHELEKKYLDLLKKLSSENKLN